MGAIRNLTLLATLLALGRATYANDAWDSGWTPMEDSTLTRRSVETPTAEAAITPTTQPETSEGRNYDAREPIYSNDTDINTVIDQLINSRREGRNLGEYDQVYADGNIDEALQTGNDAMARNLIRDKLCMLGLMSCDVEEKRPYYSTIYAQGVPPPSFGGGPYGPARPMPPPGVFNARPPPPPSSLNGFGPPRKVGYESAGPYKPNYRPPGVGPVYNGGPYVENGPTTGHDGTTFNKPPPGAIIYGSKPPGPVYGGNPERPPYNFENAGGEKLQTAGSHQNNFYAQHSAAASSSSASNSKIVIGNVDALASAAALQQHVHHHYHHVEGADGAAVGNVPSVPIPIGAGQSINTDFSALAQSSTAFTPQTQNGFSQSPAFTAGFQGASQGGLLSQGINSFGAVNKPASLGGGNGFDGSTVNAGGLYQQGGSTGASGFDQSGYGSVSGSYHSQNPDYFKKDLHNTGGIVASATNGLNSYGGNAGAGGFNGGLNSFNGGLNGAGANGGYNGGGISDGYDTARNQFVDCQCVPFNQCPAADRIGRKEDLILPIDPRNLADKDIEALSDEAAANITASASTASDSKDNKEETDKQAEKERSKRQAVAQDKQSDDLGDLPLDAQGHGLAAALPALLPALQAIALTQRKILPTYGVSFGLPTPNGAAYPVNAHGGFQPVPNPNFGSIGPNGLSLGLVNVNPLVSVQVAKTYYGEKVVKPFVNLHVTPSANILEKVGDLFRPKPQPTGPELVYNTHYHDHHHHHFAGASQHHDHGHHSVSQPFTILEMVPSRPIFEYHSSETVPLYQHHAHQFQSGTAYAQTATAVAGGLQQQKFYYPSAVDSLSAPYQQQQDHDQFAGYGGTGTAYLKPDYEQFAATGYASGYGGVYDRSANVNVSQIAAANDDATEESSRYQEFNLEPQRRGKQLYYRGADYNIPTPAPGAAEGSAHITFPSDRRRRRSVHSEQPEPEAQATEVANESVLGRAAKRDERAYYGNRPTEKTCRVNEVCCRRPLRPVQQQQQAPQYGRCGVRNAAGITGRIKNPVYVDGDSEFGEYPWHVAILKKDPKESIYACGGTLIDAQHVITAAHCIKSQNGFDLRARLGEWDVNHDVEFFPYIERDIVSVHIHPEYYAGTLDNDLAVLKLDHPVDFTKNPHISPACLPDKFADFTGARCWTTGWGKDAFGEQGKYQNILKEVDVPILSHHQCESQLRNTRLGYGYKLNPGFVCAGGEEGKDACKGDGGGPLVCDRSGVWNVVGVVSWGIGCGQVNVPGVYVRVAHYLDWIRQITQYYQ